MIRCFQTLCQRGDGWARVSMSVNKQSRCGFGTVSNVHQCQDQKVCKWIEVSSGNRSDRLSVDIGLWV